LMANMSVLIIMGIGIAILLSTIGVRHKKKDGASPLWWRFITSILGGLWWIVSHSIRWVFVSALPWLGRTVRSLFRWLRSRLKATRLGPIWGTVLAVIITIVVI